MGGTHTKESYGLSDELFGKCNNGHFLNILRNLFITAVTNSHFVTYHTFAFCLAAHSSRTFCIPLESEPKPYFHRPIPRSSLDLSSLARSA